MKKKATGYLYYIYSIRRLVSTSTVSTVCTSCGMILNEIILSMIKRHGYKKS